MNVSFVNDNGFVYGYIMDKERNSEVISKRGMFKIKVVSMFASFNVVYNDRYHLN